LFLITVFILYKRKRNHNQFIVQNDTLANPTRLDGKIKRVIWQMGTSH